MVRVRLSTDCQRTETKLKVHFYTLLMLLTSRNSLLSLIGTSNLLFNIAADVCAHMDVCIYKVLCEGWKSPELIHIFFLIKTNTINYLY
jgi:hypothetical protein